MINISINLSDIPKEAIKLGKNGKKYLNLVVDQRKEISNFGETHTLYLSQTKEERADRRPKVYLGSGKEVLFGETKKKPDYEQLPDQAPDDNFPF